MVKKPKCLHRRAEIFFFTCYTFHRFTEFFILNWVKKVRLFDEICDVMGRQDQSDYDDNIGEFFILKKIFRDKPQVAKIKNDCCRKCVKIKFIKPMQVATAKSVVEVKRDNCNNNPCKCMKR